MRPGHVFPLVAKEGGVLMRSGHTEACVDLCRLAGLPPVGVLAELMNDDGTVMRGPELAAFAERHKLQRISIAELIAYRQARDKLIERVGEFPVESEIGTLTGYAFLTPFDPVYHMAFVYGRIGDGKNVLTRLHRANLIPDVFGGAKTIRQTLARFKAEGRGVLVVLRDGAAGVPVIAIPKSDETASGEARSRQWREVGLGAQILKDLGVSSIRLLTSSRHMTYVGLSGFGIEIVGDGADRGVNGGARQRVGNTKMRGTMNKIDLPRIGAVIDDSGDRPDAVGLRLQHHPDARGAGQGALGRRAEPVSAPRRSHSQSGGDGAGLRRAGKERAHRRHRGARQGDAGQGRCLATHRSGKAQSLPGRAEPAHRARSAGCWRSRKIIPDLKSNANFLALQSQLEGTENRIAVARRDYIEAVRAYNTALRTFPTVLWAKTAFSGNKPMAEFTATEGAEKPPQVKF